VYNHEPPGYFCPFCELVRGGRRARSQPEDVVLQNDKVTAFIALSWWPNNPGHVLIVPNPHYENLYDLPLEYGLAIHAASREIALAMKAAYGCDGISTRQHNEPAGFQEVWHYHLHVFPRWENDELYILSPYRRDTALEERLPYARKLREYLNASR